MKDFLSVKESQEYLAKHGVNWTEVWIRLQIGEGKIQSEKMFSSRVIPKSELDKIIKDKEADGSIQTPTGGR